MVGVRGVLADLMALVMPRLGRFFLTHPRIIDWARRGIDIVKKITSLPPLLRRPSGSNLSYNPYTYSTKVLHPPMTCYYSHY